MEVVNPSVMVSRLDLVVLDSAVAGIDFRRLPQGFWNIGVFKMKEAAWGAPEVGTTHQGVPGPPGAPGWGVLPSEHPQALLRPTGCLLVQKNPQKVSLRLDSAWY